MVIKDRVKQYTSTEGTGTYTFSDTIPAFVAFADAFSDADVITYAIADAAGFEVGTGTIGGSGTTLTRDEILASSNAGTAVNWGAGSREIFNTVSAATLSIAAEYPAFPETPDENHYLASDKTFKPIAVGSGSYAANLYLSNVDSADAGYKTLSYTPDVAEGIKTITANAGTVQGEKYLFDAPINISAINAGTWIKSFTRKISNNKEISTFQIRAFMLTVGEVENDLFTLVSADIEDEVYATVKTEGTQAQFACNLTDRFGIQISFTVEKAEDITLSYKVGNGEAAYLLTPLALRHSSLRSPNEDPEVQHMTSAEKVVLDGITYNSGNPTVSTNPSSTSVLWVNITSGEIFTCIDITAGANVWVGQLGTTVP